MEQVIKNLKELNNVYCADKECQNCPFYINIGVCYIDKVTNILKLLKEN